MSTTTTARTARTARTAAAATLAPRADTADDTADTAAPVHAPDGTAAFRAIHADDVADVVADDAAKVCEFRTAMTARDAAADDDDDTAAALTAKVFDRYTLHASRVARTVDGIKALLPDDAKRVRLAVWNDAGFSEAPDAAARKNSAAVRTIGQYVSRFAKVGQNLAYGLDAMGTAKDAAAADVAITADVAKVKKAAAAKDDADVASKAEAALVAWRATLNNVESAALSRVEKLFTGTGAVHFPAYVLMLNAKVNGTPAAAAPADVVDGAPTF